MISFTYSTATGYSVWLGDRWLLDTPDVQVVRNVLRWSVPA